MTKQWWLDSLVQEVCITEWILFDGNILPKWPMLTISPCSAILESNQNCTAWWNSVGRLPKGKCWQFHHAVQLWNPTKILQHGEIHLEDYQKENVGNFTMLNWFKMVWSGLESISKHEILQGVVLIVSYILSQLALIYWSKKFKKDKIW